MQCQLLEKASGAFFISPRTLYRMDQIKPDEKSDTSHYDQDHGIDIDDGIGHIRNQTVLPENIHTGITEAGHRIKHCPEKTGRKSILRDKHNSIGKRTHRLHQKSSAHDLTDHTDQTIHGIQIIVFRDQALRAHGQTPSQKQ